jgi:PAS domain S-box-containing protein
MKPLLRVLNLEDNAVDAELNQSMLSARWPECDFIRVDSRERFTEMLNWRGIDLILSDYTMPGFNGIEALALAHTKRPEIPFIFVSGTIGEDTAIEALKNGATDYVLKHRLMRLIPAVDRALREADERNQRQRAEQAMIESEHKYREVFECLGEAAFLADEQSGKIIDTNHRAEKMLGLGRGEILGQKITSFLANPTRTGTDNGEPVQNALTAPDGKNRPVRIQTTKLTLYGHPLVLRLCQEI